MFILSVESCPTSRVTFPLQWTCVIVYGPIVLSPIVVIS